MSLLNTKKVNMSLLEQICFQNRQFFKSKFKKMDLRKKYFVCFRRMFPSPRLSVKGLEPSTQYCLLMELVLAENRR
jgi:hypothetical protein